MAKKQKTGLLTKLLQFTAWLTGIIVSLAVGFALINRTLSVPYIGVVNIIAGWIVVIATLLGILISILGRLLR